MFSKSMKSKKDSILTDKLFSENDANVIASISNNSPDVLNQEDRQVSSLNNINNVNNCNYNKQLEKNKKNNKKQQNNFIKTIKSLPYFIKNKVFVFSVLSLSTLCFVITAIQFWGSKYMEKVLNFEKPTVHYSFIIVCLTAPTLGVILGGIITSCIGGYEKLSASYLCLIGAFFASLLSIPIPFMNTFWGFIGLLYGILVFGGIIFPSLLGKIAIVLYYLILYTIFINRCYTLFC